MHETLIVMSDNRPLSGEREYRHYAAAINLSYCLKKGYGFIYFVPKAIGIGEESWPPIWPCASPSGNPRHPSWAKILSALSACLWEPKKIAYIDTDCAFTDHSTSLEEYLERRGAAKRMAFLRNKPWSPESPCAGFFAFHNSEESKAILREWYMDQSDASRDLLHPWEQAALQGPIFQRHSDSISLIDDWMFRGPGGREIAFSDPKPGLQFLTHIGSEHAMHRLPYFRELARQYIGSETERMIRLAESMSVEYDAIDAMKGCAPRS